jgi:hypothetical protein
MVESASAYAGFGIPEPAPCPPWCQGKHGRPSGAVIFHGGAATGGGVVDSLPVTLSMNWAERFERGAWQPHAGRGRHRPPPGRDGLHPG